MSQGELLKELFVKIAYVVDDSSEKKLTASTRTAVIQANAIYDAFTNMAKAFGKAMVNVATSLDQAFYASGRIGASVGNIKAYSAAVANLGSTVEAGQAALESFGKFIRSQPGGLNFIASFGVKTKGANGKDRDVSEIMDDFARTISAKNKDNYPLQLKFAEMVGIDEKTWRALTDPEYQGKKAEQKSFMVKIGIDPDKTKKDARDFMNTFRDIGTIAELMLTKIEANFLGDGESGLKGIKKFLLDHGKGIVDGFTALLNVVAELGKQFLQWVENKSGADFEKSLTDIAASISSAAKATTEWITQIKDLFDTLAKWEEASKDWWIIKAMNWAAGGGPAPGMPSIIGGAQAAPYAGNPSTGAAPEDKRNWWQRNAPSWAGGKDAPGGNPAGAGSHSSGGATPAARAAMMNYAMDQLRKEGVPEANLRAAAAHLVGQAEMESGLDPNKSHDGGTGYGIYGARLERRTQMLAWMKENGYAPNSSEGQMRYMAHEAMVGNAQRRFTETRRILMNANPDSMGADSRRVTHEFEAPRVDNDRSGAVDKAYRAEHGVVGLRAAAAKKIEESAEKMPSLTGQGTAGFLPIRPSSAAPGHGGADLRPWLTAPAPGTPAPAAGADNSSNSSQHIEQHTTNHITGVHDAQEVARAIDRTQSRKNRELATLLRNSVGSAA